MPTPQTLVSSSQGSWLPVTTESSLYIRLGQTTRVVNDKGGGAETEKDTKIQSEVRAGHGDACLQMPAPGKQKQAEL